MKKQPFIFSEPDGVIKSVAMPVPSSLYSLHKPDLPSRKEHQYVSLQVAELLRKYNVKPGVYYKPDEIKMFLFDVHDNLISLMIGILRDIDVFELSKELYEILENLYGIFDLRKLDSTPDILIRERASTSTELLENWRGLSQYTLAIRYLIEMALKNCGQSRLGAGRSATNRLIALSMEIVSLDFFMDHVYSDAIPHELIINEDLEATITISDRGSKALERWKLDAQPHMFEKQKNELAGLSRFLIEPVQEKTLTDSFVWKHFELPMKEELGYSLTDWFEFNKGIISFFKEREYLRVVRKTKLIKYLENNTNLSKETIGLLINDRTLSPSIFENASISDMLPSENYWRDLRLTNRPLIELELNGRPIIIVGIETFSKGAQIVFNRLTEGKMHFSRAQSRGPIEIAVGALYTNIGNYFRDSIITRCREQGFEVASEKACADILGIPDGIGPVDIFIIDHAQHRFVLGEAKDISGILEPKEIKKQRNHFLGNDNMDSENKGFLPKLRKQECWFSENVHLLKKEFAIDTTEQWTVEGVIIVNSPLPWVYLNKEPLPILDDLQFVDRLASGKRLLTETY